MRGALDCVSAKISPTESTEVFTIHSYSAPDLSEKRQDVESQSSSGRCTTRKKYCWTLGVDLPLLLSLVTLIGLFETGVIPSNKAGFYCQDPALSFPYRGETVTTSILMIGLFIMPAIFFLLTELSVASRETQRVTQSLKNTGLLYRSYVFGLIMNLCIIEVMKGLMGAPRPIFFDLCKPDTGFTCNGTEFVSTFTCTSTYSWWDQMDSYRSFPSGHSSMSIYCGFFLAWYLQRRAFSWNHRSITLVPFLQLGVISFAAVSALTRVTDHRHHWWDVLTGTGVGLATLLYAVLCLCKNFPDSNDNEVVDDTKTRTNDVLYGEPTS